MAPPVVLSVAGSDSGGGAGIQADLKAFAACGVHGATALTALTAQNTLGVDGVHPVPGEFILAQVRAVASDLGVDAVKVGMLGDAPTVHTVARALEELRVGAEPIPVVVDPVMVAESGAVLLDASARRALVERILPLATVVTPNVAEARVLAGSGVRDKPEDLVRAIRDLGPGVVVLTGGHREEAEDVFWDGDRLELIAGERHPGDAAHGSGCTHSSALAAHLARGYPPLEAARAAKAVAAEAVRRGLRELGAGSGPVDALGVLERARSAARPRL